MISKCCTDCSPILREKCEKKNQQTKDKYFIFCDSQNKKILISIYLESKVVNNE